MTPELRAYARARDAVLDAQQALADAFEAHGLLPGPPPTVDGEAAPEPDDVIAAREALAAASAGLAAAEEPLADDLAAAWEANRDAIDRARRDARQAHEDWASVANEVGLAARKRRKRPEDLPVLRDDEVERTRAAARKVDEAREAFDAAQAAFKAGVTPEQLAAG